jgi:spore coat protein CotH
MFQRVAILLLAGALLPACGGDDAPSDPAPAEETAAPVVDESAYIFDQERVHTYNILIDPADLAAMDAEPAAEVYYPAALEFEGERVSGIEVRYKGSIGGFNGCVEGTFPDTSGAKLCPKLSMKLKFNAVDRDARFHGLKRLNLHSANSDLSLMRDRLSYRMFEEFGVPGPRAVHARVLVNGELVGLFVAVEQLDSRFTRRAFDDGHGNLYKEAWPFQTEIEGVLPLAERLHESLRTNENSDPSVARMMDFGAELAAAKDNRELQDVLERWTDVEQTLRYIAVDRAILHDDGPFHWYCAARADSPTVREFAGSRCFNHNYYWYDEEQADRFWIVPWDMDHTFRRDHFVTIPTEWNDPSPDCTTTVLHVGFGQMPPACDPMTQAWGLYEQYRETLDAFLAGPFEPSHVEGLLDRWGAQIEPFVREAAEKYGDDDCPGIYCSLELDEWYQQFYEFKLRVQYAHDRAAAR